MFTFRVLLLSFGRLSQSLKLFGGGCVIDHMKLIISGSFSEGATLANESYELNLNEILLNNQQADWQISHPARPHPGDLVPLNHKKVSQGLFYVLGVTYREFGIPPILMRRDRFILESPLYDSTLAQISQQKNGSLEAWTTAIKQTYYQSLVDNLKLGFNFHHCMFYIENFEQPYKIGETIKAISVYSFVTGKLIIQRTTGDAPKFKPGFSGARKHDKIFITGGYPNYDNFIYVLCLKSFEWESHSVTDFRGHQSGCLAVKEQLLIHAFGRNNSSDYSETTQLVDIENWKKINRYNHSEATKETHMLKGWLLYTIIIIAGMTLVLLSFVAYLAWRHYIRRRKKLHEMSPPKFHLDWIWEPFKISFETDMSLISSPNSYYESTNPLPPLTKNPDSPNIT